MELMSEKKTKVIRRRRKAKKTNVKVDLKDVEVYKFRHGQQVVHKTEPHGKVGVFLSGPPAVIGDPRNPKGVFPIEIPGKVYVSWPFKSGHHVCMEAVENIMPKPSKKSKEKK